MAVFPDSRQIEESLMQPIAREFNLSETVFLYPQNEDGSFDMRIFTPERELPTAGHPTIGTAFYLSKNLNDPNNTLLMLNQKVGRIKVDLHYNDKHELQNAVMHQPLPKFGEVFDNREELTRLLSSSEQDLLDYPIQKVDCGVPYIIIPFKNIDAVKNIKFRLDVWDELKDKLDAFVYCFTPFGSLPTSNLHGRMFAPEVGVLEDPATGSANGPLGCYVTRYNIGKGPFISEQGFEIGRPSIIHINIVQNSEDEIIDVQVGGKSVFVGEGNFYLD